MKTTGVDPGQLRPELSGLRQLSGETVNRRGVPVSMLTIQNGPD
jgi:hypothetical protein